MHDLSFLGANCKSEVVANSRNATNTLLHHGLSGSVKRTVISEQKVTHCSLLDLGLRLKPAQVPISSVPNTNTLSIVVAEGIRQHGCEHRVKQFYVGARTKPCLTPLVTGNASEESPLSSTWASMPSWNWRTIVIDLSGQPILLIIFHKPSRLTVSNALVKSTNVM